jgi:hypothetical protein
MAVTCYLGCAIEARRIISQRRQLAPKFFIVEEFGRW